MLILPLGQFMKHSFKLLRPLRQLLRSLKNKRLTCLLLLTSKFWLPPIESRWRRTILPMRLLLLPLSRMPLLPLKKPMPFKFGSLLKLNWLPIPNLPLLLTGQRSAVLPRMYLHRAITMSAVQAVPMPSPIFLPSTLQHKKTWLTYKQH